MHKVVDQDKVILPNYAKDICLNVNIIVQSLSSEDLVFKVTGDLNFQYLRWWQLIQKSLNPYQEDSWLLCDDKAKDNANTLSFRERKRGSMKAFLLVSMWMISVLERDNGVSISIMYKSHTHLKH